MIIGITTDNKQVIDYDAFKWHEQEGLPLGTQFITLKHKGIIPSWIHLYSKGLKRLPKKVVDRTLSEGLSFAYGKEFRDVVMKRLTSNSNIGNDK